MHIFIGIPTHGGAVEIECLVSLFRLQDHVRTLRPDIKLSLSWVVGTPIDIARNVLANRFLGDKTATHLLFIDDDMGFEPSLIDRFIAEDRPLVSSFYPTRQFDIPKSSVVAAAGVAGDMLMSVASRYVATGHIIHQGGHFEPSKTGFVQVSGSGTGIMLIRREVFDTIAQDESLWRQANDRRYSQLGLHGAILQAFAPILDDDGLWLSEDLSFCRRWTNSGGEIWACVDEEITHVGRIAVRGKLRDQLDHFGGLPPND